MGPPSAPARGGGGNQRVVAVSTNITARRTGNVRQIETSVPNSRTKQAFRLVRGRPQHQSRAPARRQHAASPRVGYGAAGTGRMRRKP